MYADTIVYIHTMYSQTMNGMETNTKSRTVVVRVDAADYEILKNYAATLRIPITSMVRMIVLKQIQAVD